MGVTIRSEFFVWYVSPLISCFRCLFGCFMSALRLLVDVVGSAGSLRGIGGLWRRSLSVDPKVAF